MKFTKEIIVKAWKIRKSVAVELGCKVNAVLWGECISLAEECESNELATLEGSEKQIAWAESIRNNFINGNVHCHSGILDDMKVFIIKALESENEDLQEEEDEDEIQDIKESISNLELKLKKALIILKRLQTETSAKWFIDMSQGKPGTYASMSDDVVCGFRMSDFE